MTRQTLLMDLGLRDYSATWSLQRRLVELRADGRIPDALIVVEHPHVVTVGRRGKPENILTAALPIYHVERGGDVTYHGPGQLVGYPIVSLQEAGVDVKQYVWRLEEALIRAVAELGVRPGRQEGHAGVWVGGRKLASIGVAIQRWVTFHGFALNVNTDLNYFALIRPCGLEGSAITSLRELHGVALDLQRVKQTVVAKFQDVFDTVLVPTAEAELLGMAPPSVRPDAMRPSQLPC